VKAKNNRELTAAIVRFSGYLLLSAGLAVGMYASLVKTSSVEMRELTEKSSRYDRLRMQQVLLAESVDSLYHYVMLLNSGDVYINQSAMFNLASIRSIRFNESLETMEDEDCPVYKKLAARLDPLLQLKDSIRHATADLEALRDEYMRCMNRNRDINRRLFVGKTY
jgi:hypothetical protein